jgi:hypothetical protein
MSKVLNLAWINTAGRVRTEPSELRGRLPNLCIIACCSSGSSTSTLAMKEVH